MQKKYLDKTIDAFTLCDKINLDETLCGGQKKVYVFTPPNFDNKRDKKYKVIYIFDGQNAFEMQNDQYKCSAPNSWGLDTVLSENACYLDYVVVGIFNGEGEIVRDTQLTMSQRFGKLTPMGAKEYGHFENGQLEALGDFMLETLIPYVIKNYNVSNAREDVTILGASSGGLASLYLGLRDSAVYGPIGAFSPASGLFYTRDWQRFLSQIKSTYNKQKIYIYCGRNTSDFLEETLYKTPDDSICSADKLKGVLSDLGVNDNDVVEDFVDGAIHNEIYWNTALYGFINFITK